LEAATVQAVRGNSKTCGMADSLQGGRPNPDSYTDDDGRIDEAAHTAATDAYLGRFLALLDDVRQLSMCKDAELIARFIEDDYTSTPVFATDRHVLEFNAGLCRPGYDKLIFFAPPPPSGFSAMRTSGEQLRPPVPYNSLAGPQL
jgi:hypothetical protein